MEMVKLMMMEMVKMMGVMACDGLMKVVVI